MSADQSRVTDDRADDGPAAAVPPDQPATRTTPAQAPAQAPAPAPASGSGSGSASRSAGGSGRGRRLAGRLARVGRPAAATRATAAGTDPGEGDPWARFAPVDRRPGRARRAVNAVGRLFVHEWSLAGFGALLLAVVMTWPTLRYPQYTIPQDLWDPTLQAWQMAWSGHILTSDAGQLWHGNAFYPDRYSFAFTDTLLGYAPAGMIGEGPQAALVRYNIMFVLAHALAFFGAYALVRQLGAGRTGAAVAGVAFAYAPWRLAQAGHLHVLSTGGIALALAMLARGHGWSMRHGYRPARRHAGWALAGWLVAAWQISLGFGIGLPFAYVLAVVAFVSFVMWWVRRAWFWGVKRPFGVRLALADLFGGLAFAATGVLLSLPYFKVTDLHPYAKRSVDELKLYSVPINGFIVAPAESRIWGGLHADVRETLLWPPEMTLLPGFVLCGLALAGLFFSVWRVHQRLLLLAGVAVTVILGMGTRFFGGHVGYLLLYEYLPGWEGLRTPGRFILWTTLLLGVLAAGAVGAFIQRSHETRREPAVAYRLGFWLRLATLAPLLLVTVEGINATPHPVVPPQPEAMRTARSPILVLPSNSRIDNNVMLWSTDRFEPIVNGNSGFDTRRLTEVRAITQAFPDQTSVEYLRELGVRTVIVLRDRVAGTPLAAAATVPVDHLGVTREEVGNAVVFRLTG